MIEYASLLAGLAASILIGAWTARAAANQRDARLMADIGAVGLAGAAAVAAL